MYIYFYISLYICIKKTISENFKPKSTRHHEPHVLRMPALHVNFTHACLLQGNI